MATKRTKTRLFLEKASVGCVTPPGGQLRNWIPETELDQQEGLRKQFNDRITQAVESGLGRPREVNPGLSQQTGQSVELNVSGHRMKIKLIK